MTATRRPSDLFIIAFLGCLSVISPFAIDMYLPAFSQLGEVFSVPSATISLTLSSYFIGLAFGQVFYGPLLDRFGRKRPLYFGLTLFLLASFGCAHAPDINTLILLRLLQGLGGCVAQVASLAMVRDFFTADKAAKILSRMFLFIAVSPLLAPSAGNALIHVAGWQAVFWVMAAISVIIMAMIYFSLPEGHTPDPTISLKPGPIMREYLSILRHPRFITYAMSGAFAFAGLFTYVAGSPIIFMDGFHLSAETFSLIFAAIAVGFIGTSQFNAYLLNRFSSESLYLRILLIQTALGLIFLAGTWLDVLGLWGTFSLFFAFLSCAGLTYPNAAAIAIIPFTKNAGSASALLGFIQLGVGSVISTGISMFVTKDSLPIIAILAVTSTLGLLIVLAGRKRAEAAKDLLD